MPKLGEWRHGTVSGAKRHKCECPLCIAALLDYNERETRREIFRRKGEPYRDEAPQRCECGGFSYVDEDDVRRCCACGKRK